jgi:hypothetical protein
MAVDQERIIEYFGLKPFGSKNWFRSNQLVCPNCGQNDEFALRFSDNGAVLHCLHSKTCNNYSTSLRAYLNSIGKSDLVNYEKSINLEAFPDFTEQKIEENTGILEELPIKKPPIGFKRVDFDEYLDSRGFLPKHYDLFKVGITKLDPRYKKHLIFQIINSEDQSNGWLARSRESKEWHKANLERFKEGKGNLVLRYDNSPNTDFGMMLGGYNEITENTHTIIIVEGLFDKINIDKQLSLLDHEEIKGLFSFGDTLTPEQIDLINKKENITTVYLLYDEGTISKSKQYGMKLMETKKDIRVCEIQKKDLDPGEMNTNELLEAFEQSVSPIAFNFDKIDGI